MQLSNVPEVRPARRLLVTACVLFAAAFLFNVATVIIGFRNHDSDRWLSVVRLIPNLIVPLLIWRGYVLLAAMAERAAIYKRALEDGLPRLQAAVDRQRLDRRGAAGEAATADLAAPAADRPVGGRADVRAAPAAAPQPTVRPARE